MNTILKHEKSLISNGMPNIASALAGGPRLREILTIYRKLSFINMPCLGLSAKSVSAQCHMCCRVEVVDMLGLSQLVDEEGLGYGISHFLKTWNLLFAFAEGWFDTSLKEIRLLWFQWLGTAYGGVVKWWRVSRLSNRKFCAIRQRKMEGGACETTIFGTDGCKS